MSATLVVDTPEIKIYHGRADTWEGDEQIDLVFTNPYGPLPKSLHGHPMLVHQWGHRRDELQNWIGAARLYPAGWWNGGREEFWTANWGPINYLDIQRFKPEPAGWYPPDMVRQILSQIDTLRRPFTIWDGFMGRGTIGKVARDSGMNYVGVEELQAHISYAREYLGL